MEPFQEKGGSAANRHDKRGDMHTDSQTYEGGRVGTQAKVKERERREQHTQGHTRPSERNGERRGRVEIRKTPIRRRGEKVGLANFTSTEGKVLSRGAKAPQGHEPVFAHTAAREGAPRVKERSLACSKTSRRGGRTGRSDGTKDKHSPFRNLRP